MILLAMTVTDERRVYDAYIEQCTALEENTNIKFSIKECIVYWNDKQETASFRQHEFTINEPDVRQTSNYCRHRRMMF